MDQTWITLGAGGHNYGLLPCWTGNLDHECSSGTWTWYNLNGTLGLIVHVNRRRFFDADTASPQNQWSTNEIVCAPTSERDSAKPSSKLYSCFLCQSWLQSFLKSVTLCLLQNYIHGSSQAQFVAETHIVLLFSILHTEMHGVGDDFSAGLCCCLFYESTLSRLITVT